VGTGFAIHQFSEVFQIRNPVGQPYVLIGGQAVNYWAERYLATEPGLKKRLPFTSADIDFRGNRDDVQHIAGQLKLVPAFPHKVAMTALAGTIPLRMGDDHTTIEIVRSIPGVTVGMVDTLAIEMEWSGKTVRVLDPISLLICKIELALTVSQAKRQDIEHLNILLFCVRGFLREMLVEVEAGNVPAKAWLGAVNRLAKLTKSTHGRKAAQQFGIKWLDLLPQSEIAECKDVKILMFKEEQLAGKNWPK